MSVQYEFVHEIEPLLEAKSSNDFIIKDSIKTHENLFKELKLNFDSTKVAIHKFILPLIQKGNHGAYKRQQPALFPIEVDNYIKTLISSEVFLLTPKLCKKWIKILNIDASSFNNDNLRDYQEIIYRTIMGSITDQDIKNIRKSVFTLEIDVNNEKLNSMIGYYYNQLEKINTFYVQKSDELKEELLLFHHYMNNDKEKKTKAIEQTIFDVQKSMCDNATDKKILQKCIKQTSSLQGKLGPINSNHQQSVAVESRNCVEVLLNLQNNAQSLTKGIEKKLDNLYKYIVRINNFKSEAQLLTHLKTVFPKVYG